MVVADGHDLQESPLRWIPFLAVFLYVYIEISIFIRVAHVLGVLMTLIPWFLRLLSVCRWYVTVVLKTFADATKMAAGESPAAEMIKSVSLIIAGLLLLLPGFFTDFLGLLLCYRRCKNIWRWSCCRIYVFPGCRAAGLARVLAVAKHLTASISVKVTIAIVLNIKTIVGIKGRDAGRISRVRRYPANRYVLRHAFSLR